MMPTSAINLALAAAKSTEAFLAQMPVLQLHVTHQAPENSFRHDTAAYAAGNAVTSLIASVGTLKPGAFAATVFFTAITVPAS